MLSHDILDQERERVKLTKGIKWFGLIRLVFYLYFLFLVLRNSVGGSSPPEDYWFNIIAVSIALWFFSRQFRFAYLEIRQKSLPKRKVGLIISFLLITILTVSGVYTLFEGVKSWHDVLHLDPTIEGVIFLLGCFLILIVDGYYIVNYLCYRQHKKRKT